MDYQLYGRFVHRASAHLPGAEGPALLIQAIGLVGFGLYLVWFGFQAPARDVPVGGAGPEGDGSDSSEPPVEPPE